jgi:phospholipase/lecithinase/hemolysin
MATIDRNEFLRGVLAAGAASFAHSVAGANFTAHLEPSAAAHELANVQRLLDAAADRLAGALGDATGIDPAVVAGLESIRSKAMAIARQVEATLPLG